MTVTQAACLHSNHDYSLMEETDVQTMIGTGQVIAKIVGNKEAMTM